MPLDPHNISLSAKSWSPIHRDSPTDCVSTILSDILYGDEREATSRSSREATISSSPISGTRR